MASWAVAPDEAGVRLDAFLRRKLPQLSARELKRMIEAGDFAVDRKRRKKSYIVRPGELVTFVGDQSLLGREPPARSASGVRTVYEDEDLLIVDKPAGMPTHGYSARETESLANHLVALWPELKHVGKSPWQPGLVNRLDRETSGLVLVARNPEAFGALTAQLHSGEVEKKYWALVCGATPAAGTIDYPLVHAPKNRRKMVALVHPARYPGEKRWPAVTHYRRLGSAAGFTFVEAEMKTGVMHQIRAHFAALGNPLAGDALYGGRSPLPGRGARHFLHAFYLACRHPRSGAVVACQSPLPADLAEALRQLGIDFTSLRR